MNLSLIGIFNGNSSFLNYQIIKKIKIGFNYIILNL